VKMECRAGQSWPVVSAATCQTTHAGTPGASRDNADGPGDKRE
jgi:hypothetical protein